MNIKIFGKLTDTFQTEKYVLKVKVETVSELKKELEIKFPDLKNMNYLVIINNENARNSDTITEKAEVALLPPYSGG